MQGQRIVSVSCGAEHTVVATERGDAYAFGWGRYGNLGDGHRTDRRDPSLLMSVASLDSHTMLGIVIPWIATAQVQLPWEMRTSSRW